MTASTNSGVLILDIETQPNIVYAWGLWDQNIGLNQIVKPGGMLSFAAKWADDPHIMFDAEWRNGKEGMLHNLWELMDEAEAVCGFNSNRFDIRHINTEFAQIGLGPPSPYKKIDLMQTAKRHMKFPSNKLEYIAGALGVGSKLETGGFELWVDVMAGNKKAQQLMQAYNEQDVLLTEEVYHKLRPWLAPAVNKSLLMGHVCPECGGTHLQARGYRNNATTRYQRWQCLSCHSWSQSVVGEKLDRTQMLKKETM